MRMKVKTILLLTSQRQEGGVGGGEGGEAIQGNMRDN